MSDQSPALGLPYILPAQAQKHVTHNAALDQLDTLVQLHVISASTGAPPASPVTGDRYIVASGASADWMGQENTVTLWDGNQWQFTPAVTGWRAYVVDQNTSLAFDGGAWIGQTLDLQNLGGVGINTTSDGTNKLAVASDATLLNHNGAGHQLKINKAATGDTAALLFQNNWSGRAEIGLTGDDDLHLKVSSDGSSFTEALTLEANTGFAKVGCLFSGRITISSDSVGYIDTPSSGGFVLFTVVHSDYPQIPHSGIFVYDTGASLMSLPIYMGSSLENHGTATLTGTTATAARTGFAVQAGQLQIENRHSGPRTYSYTFIGGT